MNEQPSVSEYQKSYIELIARRVGDEIEGRVKSEMVKSDERLRKVEQKVYNGINFKINMLMAFYGLSVAGLITLIVKFVIK